MNTFSLLKTAIATRMKRSNLTSVIPDFITLAEDRIGQELRTWRMESLETLSITESDSTVDQPTRCREIKWMKLSGTYERVITYMPPAVFFDMYGQQGATTAQTGPPKHFTLQERSILIGPVPDDDYTATALCILGPVALSDANPSNDLLTNYPTLYFYAALVEGFTHVEHEARLIKAEAGYMKALARANKESRLHNMAGTPVGIRSIGRRKVV